MGAHLINGQFQSDKYPTCPPGKVPLSVEDKSAQDLLWEYAQRRREIDAEFSADLEAALLTAGFDLRPSARGTIIEHAALLRRLETWAKQLDTDPRVGAFIAAELRARINGG
jgi:hypothetical protein